MLLGRRSASVTQNLGSLQNSPSGCQPKGVSGPRDHLRRAMKICSADAQVDQLILLPNLPLTFGSARTICTVSTEDMY